jgi:hypothetical protein
VIVPLVELLLRDSLELDADTDGHASLLSVGRPDCTPTGTRRA